MEAFYFSTWTWYKSTPEGKMQMPEGRIPASGGPKEVFTPKRSTDLQIVVTQLTIKVNSCRFDRGFVTWVEEKGTPQLSSI
jgi:hypothetical protein